MRIASVAIAAGVIGWAAAGGAAAQSPPPSLVQSVLFLCPHGAAKSVLASAYFARLARTRGLKIRVQSAGTDPDPEVAPAVAQHLRKQGYELPAAAPRKPTAQDLANADMVVSIGCDLSGLPPPRGSLRRWDDVPAPSADFAGADAAIRRHAEALVDELARAAEQVRRRPSP